MNNNPIHSNKMRTAISHRWCSQWIRWPPCTHMVAGSRPATDILGQDTFKVHIASLLSMDILNEDSTAIKLMLCEICLKAEWVWQLNVAYAYTFRRTSALVWSMMEYRASLAEDYSSLCLYIPENVRRRVKYARRLTESCSLMQQMITHSGERPH